MAGARIVLGGELDIASGKEVTDAKDEILGMFGAMTSKENKAIWRKAVGAGTAPASGQFLIEIQPERPASGRLFNITQLIALGTDDHTALGGVTVSWYLSGDSVTPDMTDVVFPAMAVPGEQHFSSKVLWSHPQESLFGLVYGATAGQSITLIARMGDYEDDLVQPRGIFGRGGK